MYDVIIVGARCAGSPTAMLLGRLGYRVLLVDKAIFPSDVPRCHFIQPSGTARLKRWGLLDAIKRTGCPPIASVRFDIGPFALVNSPSLTEESTPSYGPRRTILDKLLVDAATSAGVEVREGFSVQEILMDGNQVTGIRGRTRNGTMVTESAMIIVGADGMRSIVARTVDAPVYQSRPALTFTYFAYWSGVAVEGMEVYLREKRAIFMFPTNNDLTCIAIECPAQEFQAFRANIEAHFLGVLAVVPGLTERVQAGHREERFMGSGDLPNFYRKAHGPGWVLVGDAGYHKDPILAQGISDAFRDAQLVAEALDAGLSGRRKLAEALDDYERRRNEETMSIYELNAQLARLDPPSSEMLQILRTLHDNPAGKKRFFGILAGSVPISVGKMPTLLQGEVKQT